MDERARPHSQPGDDIAALTAAIAAGDGEAFAGFYRAWFDRAHAMARRSTGRDESFCLDVVQDAMLRVVRRLPPLPNEAALAAWLARTIERCALDRLRAEERRRRHERRPVTTPESDSAPDLRDAAWARVNDLSPEQQELLAARYARDWTLARIGAALGLSTGAVDGRLNRILSALRRSISS